MLQQLLTPQRITILPRIEGNWEQAIARAAKPLLEDGSIEFSYIDAMIAAVKELGPYIVLDDYFALPHAQSATGVHRLGMSLLVTREAVDLLGKPVCIFLVLATLDHDVHLQALADVSAIWTQEGGATILREGSKEDILALLQTLA